METREFLKRYAFVYCYAASLCLILATGITKAVTTVSSRQAFSEGTVIIIDAGHGGIDGGATSCTGVLEQTVNLEIAKRLDPLLRLVGYETVMTRQTPDSLATEGDTIRQQKRSDLRNRVNLANRYPRGILVSIHQNLFPDSKFSGPQVFYANTPGSEELAQKMQEEMTKVLSPGSARTCKKADGVYLMNHVACPAVLVECGFLSNPKEEALLRDKNYQQKLCGVLTSVLANNLSVVESSGTKS